MKTYNKLSDAEVLSLMQSDTPIARARRVFSSASAHLEQQQEQRVRPTIFEVRRMEFKAVRDILVALVGAEKADEMLATEVEVASQAA